MPSPTVPVSAALLLAIAPGAAPAPAAPNASEYRVAQLVIQQQIVVRVQRPAAPASMSRALVKPVIWMEKKGPKCVPLDTLAGALILQPDAVDLVQTGGARVRARLDDDCPALDFYTGFYLKPTRDGKVCAGRDAVRARSGRKCEIDSFRTLVAKR